MEQLELRYYPREEIAEALSVKVTSHNFKRDVENILSKWGYGYNYLNRRGVEILSKPETAEEKLAEIIYRGYGVDIQINSFQFACFIAAFTDIEGFESMPWGAREKEIYQKYGFYVNDRTLRNWTARLIDNGFVAKLAEYSVWRTRFEGNRKIREPITESEYNELDEFYKRRSELFEMHYADNIKLGISPEEAKNAAWTTTYKDLWTEFDCCYYYCKTFVLSAFSKSNEIDFKEVYELVQVIAAAAQRSDETEPFTSQSKEFVF